MYFDVALIAELNPRLTVIAVLVLAIRAARRMPSPLVMYRIPFFRSSVSAAPESVRTVVDPDVAVPLSPSRSIAQ